MEMRLPQVLYCWWIVVIVFGAIGNAYLAMRFVDRGVVPLVFFALSVACCILCYRTLTDDEFRRDLFGK
jgi:hypothetical protein